MMPLGKTLLGFATVTKIKFVPLSTLTAEGRTLTMLPLAAHAMQVEAILALPGCWDVSNRHMSQRNAENSPTEPGKWV